MLVTPVTLSGEHVRLEPLGEKHLDGLCKVGLDDSIWEHSPTTISDESDMGRYVSTALADRDRGVALPFATVEAASGRVIGSTRFGNIDVTNRHVEIGWTWIAPNWQRTAINTEAKLLMLTHAFEQWKCIRVEFKTDVLNHRSRNAILRLGAVEEGIFRNHLITDRGRFRDSIYFSIIDKEWPAVSPRLKKLLNSYG